jgi:hypothetical protein
MSVIRSIISLVYHVVYLGVTLALAIVKALLGEVKKERIIIYTRYPEAGNTKKRMIPGLGAEGAASLQKDMTEHVLNAVRSFRALSDIDVQVHFKGQDCGRMSSWLGNDVTMVPQAEGDLGTKLIHSVTTSFREGARKVIVVGGDIPDIKPRLIFDALTALDHVDMTIGPAEDGGYYLIGLRWRSDYSLRDDRWTALFKGIDWGTEVVFRQTVDAATATHLTYHAIERVADVDRPEDLPVWHKAQKRIAEKINSNKLSIIIPTLNEEHNLPKTLASLKGGNNIEVIVVDGGSTDNTVRVAKSSPLVNAVGLTRGGRAKQLNAGAAQATGSILLFLHADTVLPRGYDHMIRAVVTHNRWQGQCVGGAFEFKLDCDDSLSIKLIEHVTNWRARVLKLPYGDQALFILRNSFEQLGRFPEVPLMDDYIFVRKWARNFDLHTIHSPAITSARRWQGAGVWRTTLLNWFIVLAYHAYVPISVLATIYRAVGRLYRQ